LDVIKDRQYTTRADSRARRSAQTALYHIAEALVRWVAPILSFTAEEIWENLPGERGESVFLCQWYEQLHTLADGEAMGRDYWQQVMAVRVAVNREIEVQRAAGLVRGSLDTTVTLFVSPELQSLLEQLADELRFVLITSAATLQPLASAPDAASTTELAGLRLQVSVAQEEKCERCWHRRPDVGSHGAHPTLCGRCVENIDGPGEQRHFA
ncbi:MAG: class I tRNA ligase family protein, partial [Haliea sp.]